jgi:hypothetical protein
MHGVFIEVAKGIKNRMIRRSGALAPFNEGR